MIRTPSVYKALRVLAQAARKSDELAEKWKTEFGADDGMRRYELVRAETYRNAVMELVQQLGLDVKELWPGLGIND